MGRIPGTEAPYEKVGDKASLRTACGGHIYADCMAHLRRGLSLFGGIRMSKEYYQVEAIIQELMHNPKYQYYRIHSIGEGVEYVTIYTEIDGIVHPLHLLRCQTFSEALIQLDRMIHTIKSKEPDMFLYLKQRIDKMDERIKIINDRLKKVSDKSDSDIKYHIILETIKALEVEDGKNPGSSTEL